MIHQGKLGPLLKVATAIAGIALGVGSIAMFGCILLLIIMFIPQVHLESSLDALSSFGALLAGISTTVLAYLAYRTVGDWEEQTALRYEHECLLSLREKSEAYKRITLDIFRCSIVALEKNIHKELTTEERNGFISAYGQFKNKYIERADSYEVAIKGYEALFSAVDRNKVINKYSDSTAYYRNLYINPDFNINETNYLEKPISECNEIEELLGVLMEHGEPDFDPSGELRNRYAIFEKVIAAFDLLEGVRSKIEMRTSRLLEKQT